MRCVCVRLGKCERDFFLWMCTVQLYVKGNHKLDENFWSYQQSIRWGVVGWVLHVLTSLQSMHILKNNCYGEM